MKRKYDDVGSIMLKNVPVKKQIWKVDSRAAAIGLLGAFIAGLGVMGILMIIFAPEPQTCTFAEKQKWCMPYIEEAFDETENALSLLDDCEARPDTIKIVRNCSIENDTIKSWQGKWNNIMPLYQQCDRNNQNLTKALEYSLRNPVCGGGSTTYVDRIVEVNNTITIVVPATSPQRPCMAGERTNCWEHDEDD